MKALSLWQPWATLVALGFKQTETRSWSTKYRGPLAIHATKRFPDQAKLLCVETPFFGYLQQGGYTNWSTLPTGAVVAIVELVDCYRIEEGSILYEPERSFGDYTPGRFAWKLINRQFMEPVRARGAQGLWNWEPVTETAAIRKGE